MMNLKANDVVSRQSGWSFVLRQLKAQLLQAMTLRAMDMFVRPTDTISLAPMASGIYEQHAVDFFRSCAALGYDHFFIDVGANIGLTSCSAALLFDRFYAFEPNPLAFKILEVNIACSEAPERFQLFKFGIGEKDQNLPLIIPKRNWGGAFVESQDNSYDDAILLSKDSLKEKDANNYLRTDVDIREGAPVFREVFSEIIAQGGVNGVIKIDVEGFELSVIRQIARSIPGTLSAYILFENWDASLDIDRFSTLFAGRATPFRLDWKRGRNVRRSRLLRRARFLAGLPFGVSDMVYRLEAIDAGASNVTGDLVMHIARTDQD